MDNNDDAINNAIIKVASLEKEYDVVLKQYQEAYKNYINKLKSSSDNPCENYKLESKGISQECYNKIWSDQMCTTQAQDVKSPWQKEQTYDGLVQDSYKWATFTDEQHRKGCYSDSTNYNTNKEPTYSLGKDFTELPGRTWWGTYGIKEGAANTKDDCVSMCASDGNCTGATFNSVKRYCWTRGGDGILSTGLGDDNALIPKLKESILILKGLNTKLISINEELVAEVTKINPKIYEEQQANDAKKLQFDKSYKDLYKEQTDINQLFNEYDSIESELNDETIKVEQSNSSLRLWSFMAFILLFIVIKQIFGSEVPTSIISIIIITIILLFLSLSLRTPSGFATIGFIIIALIAIFI